MNLCTFVSEEEGDGEGVGSEVISLLSYTLRYVSAHFLNFVDLLQQNKKRRRSGEICHVFNYDVQRSR